MENPSGHVLMSTHLLHKHRVTRWNLCLSIVSHNVNTYIWQTHLHFQSMASALWPIQCVLFLVVLRDLCIQIRPHSPQKDYPPYRQMSEMSQWRTRLVFPLCPNWSTCYSGKPPCACRGIRFLLCASRLFVSVLGECEEILYLQLCLQETASGREE